MSNACYRVFSIKNEALTPLLYRKFSSKLGNKSVEAIIFKHASERGIGPKLIFQNGEYRIEEFLNGRPLTIWELRNPYIYGQIARMIFNFNHNTAILDQLTSVMPKTRLQHDMYMHEWAPEVKKLLPSLRHKLLNDSVAHPGLLKALDEVETHFLFDGYQKFFENYLNRQNIVLAHNDT